MEERNLITYLMIFIVLCAFIAFVNDQRLERDDFCQEKLNDYNAFDSSFGWPLSIDCCIGEHHQEKEFLGIYSTKRRCVE